MDDTLELQREWRQIVLNKLDALEKSQKSMEDKVVSFTMNSVKTEEYQRLERRVRALEETKTKALAILAVIQTISVIVAWLISTMYKISK